MNLPQSYIRLTDSCLLVFTSSDPIAMGASWTAAADMASEISWQRSVCRNLSSTDLISAGVYFGTSPMSIQALATAEGTSSTYVKDYCSHNYPQSASTANLTSLMNHAQIKTQIKPFAAEAAAAKANGKPHILGETNSGKTSSSSYLAFSHLLNLNSYTRWWRDQSYIWRRPVDLGLCHASCSSGHRSTVLSSRNYRQLLV